ncbi:hypothetical protein SNL152K_4092 [Streptomyces sp. NL15-2K]|nr:hypothetical protein SNL152K_4092 [Streptomyces sp. NL15-2K]
MSLVSCRSPALLDTQIDLINQALANKRLEDHQLDEPHELIPERMSHLADHAPLRGGGPTAVRRHPARRPWSASGRPVARLLDSHPDVHTRLHHLQTYLKGRH